MADWAAWSGELISRPPRSPTTRTLAITKTASEAIGSAMEPKPCRTREGPPGLGRKNLQAKSRIENMPEECLLDWQIFSQYLNNKGE